MAAFEAWFEENKHGLATVPAPYNAYRVVWNAAIKHAEALKPSHNSASDEICDDNVCVYCVYHGEKCSSVKCTGSGGDNRQYDGFIGRKLRT